MTLKAPSGVMRIAGAKVYPKGKEKKNQVSGKKKENLCFFKLRHSFFSNHNFYQRNLIIHRKP